MNEKDRANPIQEDREIPKATVEVMDEATVQDLYNRLLALRGKPLRRDDEVKE